MKTEKLTTKYRKIFLVAICIALVFSVNGTALADTTDIWPTTVPGNAKSYSASICRYGFTTSQYIPKPTGGFGSTIHVSTDPYIEWDNYTDYDFYEFARPKDQNGNYVKSSWGMVYTGWSGSANSSILTMSPSASATRIYLRIENPGYTIGEINWYTGDEIGNMETDGNFWL